LGKPFRSHDEIIKADPTDIIAFLQQIGRLPANDIWCVIAGGAIQQQQQ